MRSEQRVLRKKQQRRQWSIEVLTQGLTLLAQPAEFHAQHLPPYQVISKEVVDRASILWDCVLLVCPDELSDATKRLLSELKEAIEQIPSHLWGEAAFRDSTEWDSVRHLAAQTLASLGSEKA